jgi:hypothetical protein
MQTFITDYNPNISAASLDNKRLGKQRVEALQIADCLLNKESRWANHPAVKMWRGYEPFLVKVYILTIINEWEERGFKNTKCAERWQQLYKIVKDKRIKCPEWVDDDFIEAHRSNLIRKLPEFYSPKFQNTKSGLEYIWPAGRTS